MENIKIFICTHKETILKKGEIYIPLLCGADYHKEIKILGDNTGDNISIKNKNYCELTGIYWIWKNINSAYKGICHYRRYFNKKNIGEIYVGDIEKGIKLEEKDIKNILETYDVIVGKPEKGYPNVEEDYNRNHKKEDMEKLKEIIYQNCENKYVVAMEKILKGNKFYPCNMIVAKKEIFDDYCKWLFGILFKLEKETKISKDPYQARVFGFISERMLGIYLEANQLKIKELNVTKLEENLKLNLLKKIKYYFKLFL